MAFKAPSKVSIGLFIHSTTLLSLNKIIQTTSSNDLPKTEQKLTWKSI